MHPKTLDVYKKDNGKVFEVVSQLFCFHSLSLMDSSFTDTPYLNQLVYFPQMCFL